MAVPRIRLNAQQDADLAALCALGPAPLDAVLAALRDAEGPAISATELRGKISDIVGEDDSRALIRQLIAFAVGVRRTAFQPGIVEAISEALRDRSWSSEQLNQWEAIKDRFWKLVSQPSVRHVAKALDLSHDYANLFDDLRIITDLRPVFDDEHSDVMGGIIRHVIRLSYFGADGPTSLSIATDRMDIEKILKACEAALKKEATLTNYLENPKPIIKLMPREERDELR